MRRDFLTASAAVLALLVAGCGSDDPDDPTGPASSAGSESPESSESPAGVALPEFSVASALAELPAVEEATFAVSTADLAALREANGATVPDVNNPDEVSEFAVAMTGEADEAVAMVVPPESTSTVAYSGYAELVGFSWVGSERMASVSAPSGDFIWGSYAEPVTPTGNFEDRGDGVLADEPGTGVDPDPDFRIGVEGNEAVTSVSADHVAGWLSGDGPTLADDEALGAVAEALDGQEVVSGYLSRLDAPEHARTIGLGWTVVDGEPGLVIVYDAGDEAAATAKALRSQYADPEVAERLEVDAITAEGRVVVVTAAPAAGPVRRVSVALSMLTSSDLPLGP